MAKIHKSCSIYSDEFKPVIIRNNIQVIQNVQAASSCPDMIEEARKSAEEIVNAAKENAEKIIEAARFKADQHIDEAIKQGYESGLEEAKKVLRAKEKNLLSKYDNFVSELNKRFDDAFYDIEANMTELSFQIAEKVIKTTIERDKAYLKNLITAAMTKVKENERAAIRLNPVEYKYINETGYNDAQKNDFELISDDSLGVGSCVIETDSGCIDAGVDVQLQKLSAVLQNK